MSTFVNNIVYYRTTILYFKEDPYKFQNQEEAIVFYEDGLLIVNIETGIIQESGEYKALVEKLHIDEKQINNSYVGKLTIPGFIDCHTHFPQTEMMCAYSKSLVQWLNTYTFPTEKQFGDIEYARDMAEIYINLMLQSGTTSALVFASVHKESVIAVFDEAIKKNMRILSGKTLMDRNAPEYLTDTPELAYSESKELIDKYHNNKRCLYSITPRFAPTSTPEQLKMAGKLKEDYPDVWVHTHLNENIQEIEWVKYLFPDSKSYLGVYEENNLLHKKSVFAHCVHCSQADFDQMNDVQCGVAFCPTSNGFLGAGIFDYHKSVQNNMNFGIGTDIGAGTDFSILKTLQDAYKFIMLSQQNTEERRPMTAFEGFYRATFGGAKALSIDDKVGKLEKGFEADFVVLDWTVSKIQKLRQGSLCKIKSSLYQQNSTSNNINSHNEVGFQLQEKLFGLMMMGDSNNTYATHIAGIPRYQKEQVQPDSPIQVQQQQSERQMGDYVKNQNIFDLQSSSTISSKQSLAVTSTVN